MYSNLREYINYLEEKGELLRIKTQVDPVLEIAELTDRQSKLEGGGKALLFENCGGEFPVITNMMGSIRRMEMALGVDSLDEPADRIDELFATLMAPRTNLISKLGVLPSLIDVSKWFARSSKSAGECQQVIHRDGDLLSRLPILKCWPHDGGRFVTLPLVTTVSPSTGIRNVGMYRMQVFSDNTTGMHWHLHKTGERHYREYKELGQKMPVSICLGGDPAYTYSAVAPLPDGIDEWLLAGFLRRKAVNLVKCITNDLYVPSDCDFIIEGYVDPSEEKVVEGPFGDHTGFYSLEDYYPTLHVTAITHRKDAIYPATLVGVPPQEDAYIALATERLFISPLRATMLAEIRDMYLPEAGVAHNLALINIKQEYQGQALKVANMLWGAHQMMFNKFMIITSSNESVRDISFMKNIVAQADFEKSLLFSRGVLDMLDHAAPEAGQGGKLALDATSVEDGRFESGLEEKDYPSLNEYLLKEWQTSIIHTVSRVSMTELYEGANKWPKSKIVVILDEGYEPRSAYDMLWICTGNCDAVRDVIVKGSQLIVDARIKAGGINGFDRRWPNPPIMSEDIINKVDNRWSEYGIGEFIASPSHSYAGLVRGEGAAVEPQK